MPFFSSLSSISTTRQFVFGRSKKPDLYAWTIGSSFTFAQPTRSRTGSISGTATTFGFGSDANAYFNVPQTGYLRWRPPADATYYVECFGAGQSGCEGAAVAQRIFLKSDQFFFIVPGSQGADTNQGSGGSFFAHDPNNSYTTATELIIAGGGGSTYSGGSATHTRGRLYPNPSTPSPPNGSNGVISATTGFGGYGYHGAPGGGFYGAGIWGSGGQQGSRAGGGFRVNTWGGPLVGGTDQGDGGFGGGGGYHSGANAGGGGGGYTGGAGGNGYSGNGSGGGSFLTASFNSVNGSAYQTHDGTFAGSSSFNGISIGGGMSLRDGMGFIRITRIN